MTNGIRNMPAYGAQISAHDRWAIILYLRALQRSRTATLTDVDPAERANLK
jgi:mono/diheme cytochrome c family protein